MRKIMWFAAACLFTAAQALAQTGYPSRPIQIIVPFAAGGGNDLLARAIGDKLQKRFGWTVVVENKPGAGGNIGTDATLRAPADGYTLLLATNTIAISPYLNKATAYDVRKDFAPIAKLAKTPFILVINDKKIPAKTLADLISYAKASPGTLTYASVGVGTPHHLGMEMFKAVAGVDLVHVPYRGSGPALPDLLAGQVQLMFLTVNAVRGLVEKGEVRALATPEPTRMSSLPEIPTMEESGVSGVDFTAWYGVLAKAGTPESVRRKLTEAMLEIVNEAEMKERILSLGFEISADGPEETQKLLNTEFENWGKVTRAIGITAE